MLRFEVEVSNNFRVKFRFDLHRCGFAVRLVLLTLVVVPRHKFNPHIASSRRCFHCFKVNSDFQMFYCHDKVHQNSMRFHVWSSFSARFFIFAAFCLLTSTIFIIHRYLTFSLFENILFYPDGHGFYNFGSENFKIDYHSGTANNSATITVVSNSSASLTEQHLFFRKLFYLVLRFEKFLFLTSNLTFEIILRFTINSKRKLITKPSVIP